MLDIDVYSRVSGFDYKMSAIIDSFKSLIIDDNFQDFNKFELTLSYSKENAELFKPETILKLRDVYYFVTDAQIDNVNDKELTVLGKSLYAKAYDRIVDSITTVNLKPEQFAWNLLNGYVAKNAPVAVRYNYLNLGALTTWSTDNIQTQNSYGVVGEVISKLFEAYDFGMKEAGGFDDVTNTMTLYKGRDLRKTIEISTDFENLINSGYEASFADYRNYAIVLGEGEGAERTRLNYTIDGSVPTGIDRREIYVDARDLQKAGSDGSASMTDAQYLLALKNRGQEKLKELDSVLTLKGELNVHSKLYQLGVDFGLGDTVTIRSALFGVSNSALITSIKYTYDTTGEYVEPTFGKQSPTIQDIVNRK